MLPAEKITKSRIFLYAGILLTLLCLVLLIIVFYPAVKSELNYSFNKPDPDRNVSSDPNEGRTGKKTVVAADKDFSIVVPKIGANAKVISSVDPLNSREYQPALSRGVAHARGTSFPDTPGNTFLFAHSSDTFLNANIFNAVFYLLNKLQPDDLFYIAYKSRIYKYKVVMTDTVSPTETKYYGMTVPNAIHTATLMTCWPPATTLKRLVVIGVLQ